MSYLCAGNPRASISLLSLLFTLQQFSFPKFEFEFQKKKNSLGDCKSMAESPWASACPTPPPPPPLVMLLGLVFSSFKVFSQLSLSFHCTDTTDVGGAYYRCHHHWWLPALPSQIYFLFYFSFCFSFNYFDDQSCMILFGFEKWGFCVWLNVL